MPNRSATTQTQPKSKFTKSGTVEHSLRTVGKFCQGPEHNDYYEFAAALELLLTMTPPAQRTKFDQAFTRFKRDNDKPQEKRTWKDLQDFMNRSGKVVQPS
jgi:hypothetical protein